MRTRSLFPVEPLSQAKKFLRSEYGLSEKDYEVRDQYTSEHNGVTHIYLRQKVGDLEVINGDINLNFDRFGNLLSHGNSFHSEAKKERDHIDVSKFKFTSTPIHALSSLYEHINSSLTEGELEDVVLVPENHLVGGNTYSIRNVPATTDEVKAKQALIQDGEGNLVPVWELEVPMDDNWFVAHVKADYKDNTLLSLVDWVQEAEYTVFPLGINDPEEGDRKKLVDPHHPIASPLGWHDQGDQGDKFTDTAGNNVYALENIDDNASWKDEYRRSKGGKDLKFNYPLDLTKSPKEYTDAAVVNLFYWNNALHDLYYVYGFDEKAGNFQQNNFDRGGRGNDPVIAQAQDGSGTDNANFATPPDGRRPRMRMYVWDQSEPWRDGDLEGGIITHEYSHGLSIRLTGGPANSNCLGWGEAGGMGEGWGDAIATLFRQRKQFNRTQEFGMGEYANGGSAIRKYKYSTSFNTNPETYKTLNGPGYFGVHAIGATWAELLYEVYWNLVDEYGFSEDLLGHDLKYGNTLFLQLLLDGMKLQPCRPNFLDARDAIITADQVLTGGQNKCLIYKGFAKRGLGVNAKLIGSTPWGGGIRENGHDLPSECN
ncbi:zinc-dependent metalloprotease [Conidiobolus coronatus NRRL 28638]|uniref:Extracellular metalloproteinase n=1 Tax=Conidiobolus coronatus (strain ATCC 28846 / CBS 209.66 / NRRL 28638) TaxID=796925 RepID=A0A137PIE3_CONC2|nr:zinc-dependent metalloprotease [Conidiobolus coronatus NRRL 28638]|eukprot:KXN74711.1 zinc-dependent metalloprotease [Conidiobolus coronatus NRRL 28638]